MTDNIIHFHPTGTLVALVGNPNCGKTALFNRLTGGKQHVANYAGVTVERKEGKLTLSNNKTIRILDLPGTYSLYPRSPDERVTPDDDNYQASFNPNNGRWTTNTQNPWLDLSYRFWEGLLGARRNRIFWYALQMLQI